ncbi:MAG: inositol monophosphatase [Halobacteriovoraceae bacterium]|nr:inositol monophosphatase [Halobacteriovoraceae bacterium]
MAKKAALAAGRIIQNADRSELEVEKKEGGSNLASQVVTEIDLQAQAAILDILSPTLKKFDLGLLAEESNDDGSRFIKDYFWCIDPLDGTLAFSRDEDGYSVSIALVSRDGTPIIGVVYNPRTNSLYHAIKGQGAFKNDKAFNVENKNNKLTLLYDQSFLKIENYDEEIEKLENLAKEQELEGIEHSPLGGAVMNAITTIELAPALYYKHPKKELGGGSIWDFAASSVIHSEAGGQNSNFYGDPLDLNRADSSFMNHEGVIFVAGDIPHPWHKQR